MRQVLTYGKLTDAELREELVTLTSQLTAAYNDLAAMLQDQQHDFLLAYTQSPGHSVSAKNREAQYSTTELTRQIIDMRGQINSLILARDLAVLLLFGHRAGELPFPSIADCDAEGLVCA